MLQPLTTAPIAIELHAIAALYALAIGLVVIFRRKGDRLHRFLGRIFVIMIAGVATSAFFIYGIRQVGPFSVLHLLAALALYTLARGMWFIWHGDVAGHRRSMRILFFSALLVAFVFTLLPGRIMNDIVTVGQGGWWPIAIAAGAAGILAAAYFLNRRRIDRVRVTP